MSDVFISYSRKDSDFARKLHHALNKRDREVWIDWEDIPLTANWWREITDGIESANSFVFVMTPDSVASPICNFEIAHAIQHNKRIVPIVYEMVDEKQAFASLENVILNEATQMILGERDLLAVAHASWSALARHNWVLFTDDARFDETFDRFLNILDTDLDHAKLHTRLLVRALEWERIEKNPSFLLSGVELEAAEAWLQGALSAKKSPEPAALHRAYIQQSRTAETTREQRLRNLRRASVVAAIIGVAAIIATIVAGISAVDASNNSATAGAQAATAQGQARSAQIIIETSTAVISEQQAIVEDALQSIQTSTAVFSTQVANVENAQQAVANAQATLTPIQSTVSFVETLAVRQEDIANTAIADLAIVEASIQDVADIAGDIRNDLIENPNLPISEFDDDIALLFDAINTFEEVSSIDCEAGSAICQDILNLVDTVCDNLNRNDVCVATSGISVTYNRDEFPTMLEIGQTVSLTNIQEIMIDFELISNDLNIGAFVLNIQADLPDLLPGQAITMIIIGSPDTGIQSFYLTTGIGGADFVEFFDDELFLFGPEELDIVFTEVGIEVFGE